MGVFDAGDKRDSADRNELGTVVSENEENVPGEEVSNTVHADRYVFGPNRVDIVRFLANEG